MADLDFDVLERLHDLKSTRFLRKAYSQVLTGGKPWGNISTAEKHPFYEALTNRSEQQRLSDVYHEFGWMSALRKPSTSKNAPTFCRWIHISSKFPAYIYGVLLGLSVRNVDPEAKMESLRQVDRCIYENEGFRKMGDISRHSFILFHLRKHCYTRIVLYC